MMTNMRVLGQNDQLRKQQTTKFRANANAYANSSDPDGQGSDLQMNRDHSWDAFQDGDQTNYVSGIDQNSVNNYDEDYLSQQQMFDATQDQISQFSPDIRGGSHEIELQELSKMHSTVKLKSRVKKSKRKRAAPSAGVIEGVVMQDDAQDFTVVGEQPDD